MKKTSSGGSQKLNTALNICLPDSRAMLHQNMVFLKFSRSIFSPGFEPIGYIFIKK